MTCLVIRASAPIGALSAWHLVRISALRKRCHIWRRVLGILSADGLLTRHISNIVSSLCDIRYRPALSEPHPSRCIKCTCSRLVWCPIPLSLKDSQRIVHVASQSNDCEGVECYRVSLLLMGGMAMASSVVFGIPLMVRCREFLATSEPKPLLDVDAITDEVWIHYPDVMGCTSHV